MNDSDILGAAAVKGALLRTLTRLEMLGELEKAAPEDEDCEEDEAESAALKALRSLRRLDPEEAETITLRWLARPQLNHKLHCALLVALGDASSDSALEVLLEHLLRLNTNFDELRDWLTNDEEGDPPEDLLSGLYNSADAALRKIPNPNVLIRLRQELTRTLEEIDRLPLSPSFWEDAYFLPMEMHSRADRLLRVLAERGGRQELLELVTLLEHPNASHRIHAGSHLSRIGVKARAILPELIAAFTNKDKTVRSLVAEALGNLGTHARAAVPALVGSLARRGRYERPAVITALGKITPTTPAAIKALIGLLRDRSAETRWLAVQALGNLGPPARSAIPDLLQALQMDQEKVVRRCAVEALGAVAAPSKAILAALEQASQDKPCQEEAIRALGRFGKVALSHLLRALQDPMRAGNAARALGELRLANMAIVQGLIGALRNRSGSTRAAAAEALGELGPAAAAVPHLIAALTDRSRKVRGAAIKALRNMGPHAAAAVVPFVQRIGRWDDPDWWIICEVLGDLKKMARPALPLLLGYLRDSNPVCRARAARAFLSLTTTARRQAAPALTEALGDPDEQVRAWAAASLGSYGPAAAVPVLTNCLTDPSSDVRRNAACALWYIGSTAALAALALLAAVKDLDSEVREYAVLALGGIGAAPEEVIPVLLTALQDPAEDVRRAAAMGLGGFGAAARAALPALAPLLWAEGCLERYEAAVAVRKIAPGTRQTLPVLLQLLHEESCEWLRTSIVEELGAIGPAAAEAVPRLKELRRSDEAKLRKAAAKALRAIQGN